MSRRSGRIVEAFTLAKVEQDDRQHALFLQLVAPDGRLLVNVNTYPAHGVLATAYWPPEAALHERYSIAIPGEMPPGSRLLLGLWTPATGQRLPARDPDGKPLPDDAFNALLPDPAP